MSGLRIAGIAEIAVGPVGPERGAVIGHPFDRCRRPPAAVLALVVIKHIALRIARAGADPESASGKQPGQEIGIAAVIAVAVVVIDVVVIGFG